MIKNLNEDIALKFKNISPEEKNKKGILGRLYGNVASFAAPTRNGRKYDQSLWEQLFESDLIKERFANGGIFGQLCHPEYEEVDMEKIACVMPEPPVKDSKGNLVAYVDLVDTPCGRIAYQLAKYGYKFGISSRGTGDIIYDKNGDEVVDPDTYQLNAFDLVEIPAVESARLAFVESLDTKKKYGKTLKQKLSEEINKASDEDRKIMEESLKRLDIKLNEDTITVNEKLVEPTEEEINQIKSDLNEIGFDVDKEGKTLFGAHHLQLVLRGGNHDAETLYRVADELSDLSDKYREFAVTYNVGLTDKYEITCGLDIREKSVDEELESEDGWGDSIKGQLEQTFGNLEDLMYEVRNAVRGSYAVNGDTVQDLVSELRDLSDQLEMNADDLEFDQDSLNEDTAKLNVKDESIKEDCSDKEVDSNEEVVDDKDELVIELQEALKKGAQLEKDNLSLQEQLSVCSAKEKQLNEDLTKTKKALVTLSEKVKHVNMLKESLEEKDEELESNKKSIEEYEAKLTKVNEMLQNSKETRTLLNESTNKLNSRVKELTESLEESNNKLNNSKQLISKYRNALNEYKNSYIASQAKAYGINESDIKKNLKESYSIKDIDSICENLYEEKLNMSKLPFRLNENSKIEISGLKKDYITRNLNDDDVISENLLRMLDF